MSRYTSVTDAGPARRCSPPSAWARSTTCSLTSPRACGWTAPLDLPDGRSEQEVFDELAGLAARNRHADAETSFLGAGMYDHYVPSLVDALIRARSS